MTKIKKGLAVALVFSLVIPCIESPVKTAKAEIISKEAEWNIKRLNAETSYEDSINLPRIKVAVLDSGLDYNEDIPFVERKDFLGDEELHPLYQDYTGHGTSVASLICAKNNEDNVSGIAANVDLYAARILDKNNEAPVERVIEAVKWAMEKKVNIIHMSFGTKEYFREFENIIKQAYAQGILIIAAAGNDGTAPEDESTIEYPAAFDNVIAVGATNTLNEKTKMSATGDELDVVAPGEQILATGHFSGVAVEAGTSISAAQVTGVAAVVWGKHPGKSNAFIQSLLLGSANESAVGKNCGKGMVDYEQSNDNYTKMNAVYSVSKWFGASETEALEKAEDSLGENVKKLSKEPVNYVSGSWGPTAHSAYVNNAKNLAADYISIVKAGSMEPDYTEIMAKLSNHEPFHGGGNYIANTQYIYTVARKYFSLGNKEKLKLPKYTDVFGKNNPYKGCNKWSKDEKELSDVRYLMKRKRLNVFFGNCEKRYYPDGTGGDGKKVQIMTGLTDQTEINKRKGYALLGLALHNATDAIAHMGYMLVNKKWVRIVHEKDDEIGSMHWLWLKVSSTKKIKKGVRTFYSTIANSATIADDVNNLSERCTSSDTLAKDIISGFNNSKDCYKAFKNFSKTKIKGYRIQNFTKYWREVNGGKATFGKVNRTDEERLELPKKSDIVVRVKETKVSFEFEQKNKQNYVLCEKVSSKNIVYLGTAIGKKGKVYKVTFDSNDITKNKFRLYVFNEFKQAYIDFSISCTVEFSRKGVNAKGKKGNKEITFNPAKPVPEIKNIQIVTEKGKKKEITAFTYKYKNKKEKKKNPRQFVGWSRTAKGKVMDGFVYKNKGTLALYPRFKKIKK